MTAVFVRARADLRHRPRSWVALVVAIAIGAGGVLTLVAGARRTASAFPRFLARTNAADVTVYSSRSSLDPEALRTLPGVEDVASATALQTGDPLTAPGVLTDPRFGTDVNRFQFLEGRNVRPEAPHEAVVGFPLARRLHLHAGDKITLHVPHPVDFTVVGVEAQAGDFPPRSTSANLSVWVSPAFLATPEASGSVGQDPFVATAVRLRPGASLDEFTAALNTLSRDLPGTSFSGDESRELERSASAETNVLRIVAAVTALAVGLVLLQLFLRDTAENHDDHEVLRAMGFTRQQIEAAIIVRFVAAAFFGAALAVALAIALSPLFPLGVLGIAEPDTGVIVDPLTLGVGFVAVVLVIVALGAIAAHRGTRIAARVSDEPTTRTTAWSSLPLPHVLQVGTRFALDAGRGRRAVPVRTTLVAVALAVGSVAAAFTIDASLHHLLASPALYGVTYDAHVEVENDNAIASYLDAIRSDPDVASTASGITGVPLQAGSVTFGGSALSDRPDALEPTVLEGRLPAAANEITLGTRTMGDLHAHIGDELQIGVTGITTTPLPFKVVGRAVIAPLTDTEQLGRGAIVTAGAIDAFIAAAPPGFQPPPAGDAFVKFRPGVDRTAAIESLRRRINDDENVTITVADSPADIATFSELKDLPSFLAVFLGVVAAVTIAHLLVSSVRRRRQELAVLKALGYTPRQVGGTVVWQATVIATVALVVGLPLGIAAGRSVWMSLSTWAGVVGQPTLPVVALVALVPVAIVFAGAVALAPAMAAARTRTADVLRTD